MYREKAMATKTVWPVTVNRITVPTVDKTSATHEWLIHNSCTPQRIVERETGPQWKARRPSTARVPEVVVDKVARLV